MNLFQRKIEPRCAYCAHGKPLGADQIVCPKKGVMSAGSHCRSFRYVPQKGQHLEVDGHPRPAQHKGGHR